MPSSEYSCLQSLQQDSLSFANVLGAHISGGEVKISSITVFVPKASPRPSGLNWLVTVWLFLFPPANDVPANPVPSGTPLILTVGIAPLALGMATPSFGGLKPRGLAKGTWPAVDVA